MFFEPASLLVSLTMPRIYHITAQITLAERWASIYRTALSFRSTACIRTRPDDPYLASVYSKYIHLLSHILNKAIALGLERLALTLVSKGFTNNGDCRVILSTNLVYLCTGA